MKIDKEWSGNKWELYAGDYYRIDRLGLPNFGDRVLDCGRDNARAAAAFIAHVLGALQVGHVSDEGVESGRLGQLPSSFNFTQSNNI